MAQGPRRPGPMGHGPWAMGHCMKTHAGRDKPTSAAERKHAESPETQRSARFDRMQTGVEAGMVGVGHLTYQIILAAMPHVARLHGVHGVTEDKQ